MPGLVRIANLVMLVLFLFWAGFQYNDPDGLVWMGVYGAAAIACVLYMMGRLPRTLALLYMGLCFVWAAVLWIAVIASWEFFFEERGREAMGLMICGIWMIVLLRVPSPSKQPEPSG